MQQNDPIQDRYRLQEPIGRGGMAEVWRALDERLERMVAIKFLGSQFRDDPEFLVRFFSEAQSVARLSHPNVVSVLDFGDFEDRPYLVMEYVSGGSLADITGEPVLPERAAELVAEAARGAGAAHALGLVHRDIKPGNILLTKEGTAKLADFGIASSQGSERLTATGVTIGSPHYICPEQASGLACSSASDVYSLGVVLYELLTGQTPFHADNVTAIAIAHVDQTPRPPTEIVPDLDPFLEAVVLRCLAKDPAERFPDGSALAIALEDPHQAPAIFPLPRDLEGAPDHVRPAGRRILTVIAAATTALALLGAGVWAAGRSPSQPRPRSYDQERVDGEIDLSPREKATPTPTTSSGTAVSIDVTPSAAATATQRRRDNGDDKPRSRSAPDRDARSGSDVSSPSPTPQPTAPQASPAPTSEPTGEPSPTPTSQEERSVTAPAG